MNQDRRHYPPLVTVAESEAQAEPESLARYVPRISTEWDLDTPGALWRVFDATLCFVDISGFTNLSERLARRGRIGAEELTEVLNRVFGEMLELSYARRGSLLKFGGDALLLLFDGDDHPVQAACAAVEMRAALRKAATIPTSVGRVPLRMSIGLHSGDVHLFRVGSLHRELIVTGPGASRTTEMEAAASAGQILVSPEMAERLPRGAAPIELDGGRLLRWRRAVVPPVGTLARRPVPVGHIERCLPAVLREHLGHGAIEFEHRIATVGFIEFHGVDELLATDGAAAVAIELDAVVSIVEEACEESGIAFLASDIDRGGGKLIVVSGVPRVQEDDEGRILRAVRRVADEPLASLRLKIGVNRGHVFAGTIGATHRAAFTVMGDTVNLAARLMSAAPYGEVYATSPVIDRSRTLFATDAVAPFMVKGKSKPVQAYSVRHEIGTRSSSTTRGETPFVGREQESSVLSEALAQNQAGNGSVVTVIGDAGMGKTRLVAEAVQSAGVPVFTIRGEPNGMTSPYRALRDATRDLLGVERGTQTEMTVALQRSVESFAPDLLPMLPLIGDVAQIDVPPTPEVQAIEPRFRPARVADALVRLLDAALEAPCVIVVEDAHWTDPTSNALLERLARVAPRREWQLIVIRRPGESGFTPTGGRRVVLERLTPADLREIVVRSLEAVPLRPHEIDVILDRAAGSPLFLNELVRVARERGSLEGLPDSLDASINSEIDSLPMLPRLLLRYASVLGRTFTQTVLQEILLDEMIEPDSAVFEMLGDFLEFGADGTVEFRQHIVRDVAYEGLSYRRRRELHLRAGSAIERIVGDDIDAGAEHLSFHFFEGKDFERAWRYARVAGDRARSDYANVEAAAHYRRALDSVRRLSGVDPDEVRSTWVLVGDVLEQAGLLEDALDAYRKASALVTDDAVERAQILLKRARARERAGRFVAAQRELGVAERLLEGQEGDEAARVRVAILTLRAIVREGQERPRKALAEARRAAEAAERLGEAAQLAKAYSVMDYAHVRLGEPERAKYAPLIIEIYEALGEPDRAASALGNGGAVAFVLGRWSEALDCYRRAEAAYARTGDVVNAAAAQSNIGELLINRGQLEAARAALTDAARTHRAVGHVDGALFDEIQLGRLLRGQGEHEKAAELLEAARNQAAALHLTGFALHATIHLAECLVDQQRSDDALAILAEAERAAGEEAGMFAASVALVRALALSASDALVEAATATAAGIAEARRSGMRYELGLLLVLHSEICERLGVDTAERDRAEGVALLESLEVVTPR